MYPSLLQACMKLRESSIISPVGSVIFIAEINFFIAEINFLGSIRESYVFVIECLERQEVGSWTARVSRCGFRRRAG